MQNTLPAAVTEIEIPFDDAELAVLHSASFLVGETPEDFVRSAAQERVDSRKTLPLLQFPVLFRPALPAA